MKNIPQHLAIIPDGNRRWAKVHKKDALWRGHAYGAKQFENIMRLAFQRGVTYLTFWAASEDNLRKRAKPEISFLVKLLTEELGRMLTSKETFENKICVRVLGKGEAMVADAKLSKAIKALQAATSGHTKHFLTLLFGYDGQQEMLEAIKKVASSKQQAASEEETLRQALATGFLPDLDLVIRTGGEPHWSAGFMMWLTANSQFYFTDTLWPDFDAKELDKALADYGKRERRLGK